MVVIREVEGYENFLKTMEELNKTKKLLVLYSGSKLPNLQSWCSDCVEAEPIIFGRLTQLVSPETTVIHVGVGDRPYWKDLKCPFRTDPKIKLNVLPTLALWNTQKRLEGEQCQDIDLIEMLLNDE